MNIHFMCNDEIIDTIKRDYQPYKIGEKINISYHVDINFKDKWNFKDESIFYKIINIHHNLLFSFCYERSTKNSVFIILKEIK